MKKYFTLMILAVLGGLFVMSCDRTDTVVTEDNDTYPVMKDVTGTFTNGNTYTLSQHFAKKYYNQLKISKISV